MRFVRRIFGGEIDEAIRPLVVLQLFGSLSSSALFSFMGIWALQRLGASETGLGLAYLAMAGSAMVTGVIGGHLSDRVGRRPMMLIGRGFFCLTSLGALAAGTDTLAGLSVIAATGALSSLGDAADTAMVADLVAPDDREQAYASLRVAANMGVVLGPPIGGLLLAGSWNTLFVGAACLSAISWALAWRADPVARAVHAGARREVGAHLGRVPRPAVHDAARRRRAGVDGLRRLRAAAAHLDRGAPRREPLGVGRDRDREPAPGGTAADARHQFLRALLTRHAHGRLTMMLMGLPFLVFGVSDALPIVVAAVVVFVFGEMLWVPTMLAVVADRAPPAQRGAYMGALQRDVGGRLRPHAAGGASGSWAVRAIRRCGR